MYVKDMVKDLKIIKQKKGLSNQDIADATGVPIGTVSRVFGNQQQNFKYDTIQPIISFLEGDEIYSSTNNLLDESTIDLFKNIIKELRQELDAEKENHKAELSEFKEEAKKELTEMKTEFKRSRVLYRVAMATEAIITILLIILDYNLPGMGWIFR